MFFVYFLLGRLRVCFLYIFFGRPRVCFLYIFFWAGLECVFCIVSVGRPKVFFGYFLLGGLECVGHSFAYVALFVFLRDVWIRTQRAAGALPTST